MDMLKSMIFNSDFWFAVIRSMTPVLFATLGANIASRAGIINLALEGTMLISALVGVVISASTQSLVVGALGGLVAGIGVSLILGYFSLKLKANMVITGVALNLAATGGTVFALYTLTGDKAVSASLKSLVFPTINIPIIENIPFIGPIISGHNLLTYLAIIAVITIYVLLFKTTLGIKIRAVGESEEAAKSVGINVDRIKMISLGICGTLAAFGGMFLSMGYVSMFTANMTAGRGYIALATDAMSGSHPVGALLSSVVYGFSDAVANYMQNSVIPLQFIQLFPYLFIIILFTIFSYRKMKKNKESNPF